MIDPAREHRKPENGPPSAPDEEWADGYAQGYGDGLREALREVLSLAARGHSPQELRYLAESRLAKVSEDVAVKRKGLLAPPSRTSWGGSRAPTPPSPATGRATALPGAEAGRSYLFWEERPERALKFVRDNLAHFDRLILVSQHPPDFPNVPVDRITVIRLASVRPDTGGGGVDPGSIAGRVADAMGDGTDVAVYVDGLEFLVTEHTLELTIRLVNFLTSQTSSGKAVLVVSADPRSFEPPALSRVQRAFNIAF